jgi:hypothetical protein
MPTIVEKNCAVQAVPFPNAERPYTIDLCINNVIMKVLCSPSEQLCLDPEEVLIYWKIGASEL